MEIRQQLSLGNKSEWSKLGVIADKPKYPQYAPITKRLETFKKWPQDKTQQPQELAEAGFAYTGVQDAVRCYYCGNGLREWDPNDSPWKQHALHFPQCGHLRQCKGDMFIKKTRGELPVETDGDCDNDNNEARLIKELIEENKIAVQAAKEFDATDNQIEAAMKHCLEKKIDVVKAAELMKIIDDIETKNIEIKLNQENNNVNNQSCSENKPISESVSDSRQVTRDYSDDQEENNSLKESMNCKVCFDARACIITIPCGHMVTCPQCIGPLTKCCICRTPIQGTVRAFMAGDE